MTFGKKKKYLDLSMDKKARKIITKNIKLRKLKLTSIDKAIKKGKKK